MSIHPRTATPAAPASPQHQLARCPDQRIRPAGERSTIIVLRRLPEIGTPAAMTEDTIAELGIDPQGRLYVSPSAVSFESIYRAATEVSWDAGSRRLLAPEPRDWSYVDWFRRIVVAAADEYGVLLRLAADTKWSNVPAELRKQILASE